MAVRYLDMRKCVGIHEGYEKYMEIYHEYDNIPGDEASDGERLIGEDTEAELKKLELLGACAWHLQC